MKKCFAIFLLMIITCFCSCSAENDFNKALKYMENVCSELGGSVSVYSKKDAASISDTIVSLYGAENAAPDELALVDFGIIWYSKSISGGDGAVFYVTNTADRESVEKMCRRRQKTVKRTAGTDMTVYSSGHYVCLYSKGLPPLESAIYNIIEK